MNAVIITDVHAAAAAPRPRRIAIGVFDGVHRGHRAVIEGCDTVLTFDPHPLRVVRPEAAPKLLTDIEFRTARLAELPIREILIVPFDATWAAQTPHQFINDVLVDLLHVQQVSIGANFRFGAGRDGNTELLRADPRFVTRTNALLKADTDVISSSLIRSCVARGDIERAAELLGSPLTHSARLTESRMLEFDPTVAVPPVGSYQCLIDQEPGCVHIGATGSRIVSSGHYRAGQVDVAFLRRTS